MSVRNILCIAAAAFAAALLWHGYYPRAEAVSGPRFRDRRPLPTQPAATSPAIAPPMAITAPPTVAAPAPPQPSLPTEQPAATRPTPVEQVVQLSAERVRVADLRPLRNTTPIAAAQQYIWAVTHQDPDAVKAVFTCLDLPWFTKVEFDASLDEFVAQVMAQAARMESVEVMRSEALGPKDAVFDVRVQNKDGTVETEKYLMRLGPNGWVRDASVKSFLFLKARRGQGRQ